MQTRIISKLKQSLNMVIKEVDIWAEDNRSCIYTFPNMPYKNVC
jgi:hypothetical protein